ncbi:MAG: YitT family protein, partial [Bacilli bacterium]
MSKLYQQWQVWLGQRPKLKNTIETIAIFIVSCISSLLAAYIFRSFIVPAGDPAPTPLITGGVSGISQIFNRLFDLLHLLDQVENRTLQAIFYFIFNIPIFILAFAKIG